jgi:adenylate cyclase
MSPQSDIFSLGIVAYEMLTGHLPWDGSAFLAIQQKQEGAELPDLRESDPALPAGLTMALRQMTAFNYRERPANVAEVLRLLLAAVPNLPPEVVASMHAPLPNVHEAGLLVQDAAFLLRLFMSGWQGAEKIFPMRLTYVALIDAAVNQKGGDSLALTEAEAAFMLRGALVYDYRADFWWRQVADPAVQARVCVEVVGRETGTAVSRALARLHDLVTQQTEIRLDMATQERLLDIAMTPENWSLRQNAMQILAATLPKASHWQPVVLSETADARLAELALGNPNQAGQAAKLVGQIRSEMAVQTILAAAPETDIQEILQQIDAAAGSLPRVVPARIRLRARAIWLRRRFFTDAEGFSLPRVVLGLLAGLLVSAWMVWGLFSQPAVQMQDVLLAPYPVSDIITIVQVDDASLARYGRWDSWSRALHADLVDRLAAAGARVIAFDFMFDTAAADAAADGRLAEAIAAAGNVVQPVLGQGDGYHNVPGVLRFESHILPYAPLLAASAAVGYTNILHDEDGYVRRLPTVVTIEDERRLSLPLAALSVFLGGKTTMTLPTVQDGVLPFLGRRIPVGPSGEMSIYFAGPPATAVGQTFTMVSYADVLDGRIPDSVFKGKIVLVGIMATSEPDSYLTPVSRGRPMFGVEILANVIESVWSEHFIAHPSLLTRIAVLLGLGVLTGLLCVRPWSGLLLAGGLAVLYFAVAMLLFDLRSVMLDLLYPFMTIALSYALITAFRFSAEIRRRREMMQLFAVNVTPEVARGALTAVKKGEINLGGEVQEVSVLFVDMRGRRVFADRHEPGEVIALMNEIRDLVRGIVLANKGTVVQQESEQVMALFNVPLPQPDHAGCAVETAFDIQEGLQKYQDGLPPQHPHLALKMGYGVYTGRAIVGNVGPAPHHAYTAVGEPVALAAQLAERAAAGEVLLGEATVVRLGNGLTAEPLPPLLIKDYSTAVAVYTAVRKN